MADSNSNVTINFHLKLANQKNMVQQAVSEIKKELKQLAKSGKVSGDELKKAMDIATKETNEAAKSVENNTKKVKEHTRAIKKMQRQAKMPVVVPIEYKVQDRIRGRLGPKAFIHPDDFNAFIPGKNMPQFFNPQTEQFKDFFGAPGLMGSADFRETPSRKVGDMIKGGVPVLDPQGRDEFYSTINQLKRDAANTAIADAVKDDAKAQAQVQKLIDERYNSYLQSEKKAIEGHRKKVKRLLNHARDNIRRDFVSGGGHKLPMIPIVDFDQYDTLGATGINAASRRKFTKQATKVDAPKIFVTPDTVKGVENLGKSLGFTGRELKSFNKEILMSAMHNKDLSNSLNRVGMASQVAGGDLKRINHFLKNAATDNRAAAKAATELSDALGPRVTQGNAAVLIDTLKQNNRVMDAARQKTSMLTAASHGLKEVMTQLKGAIFYGLFLLVTAAVAALTAEVYRLDSAMREFNTLMQLSENGLQQVQDAVVSLSTGVAKSASDLAGGLRDIASSVDTTAKGAMDLLKVSADLAVGGFVTTATATQALVTVLNAYRMDISEAEKVSDVLFQTMNFGIVTIKELANEMGKVTPIAAAAGIDFEEVAASLALMTKNGNNAARSATKLARIFNDVIAPSTEGVEAINTLLQGTGKTIDATTLKMQGFEGAIENINIAIANYVARASGISRPITDLNEALELISRNRALAIEGLSKIFTDKENLTAVTQFIGKENVEEFKRLHQEMRNAEGATAKAVNEANKSLMNKTVIIKNQLAAAWTHLMTAVMPTVLDGMRTLANLITGVGEVITIVSNNILLKIPAITAAVWMLVKAFRALKIAALAASIANPWLIPLAGAALLLERIGAIKTELNQFNAVSDLGFGSAAEQAKAEIQAWYDMQGVAKTATVDDANVQKRIAELTGEEMKKPVKLGRFTIVGKEGIWGGLKEEFGNMLEFYGINKMGGFLKSVIVGAKDDLQIDMQKVHEYMKESKEAKFNIHKDFSDLPSPERDFNKVKEELAALSGAFSNVIQLTQPLVDNMDKLSHSALKFSSVLDQQSSMMKKQGFADFVGGLAKLSADVFHEFDNRTLGLFDAATLADKEVQKAGQEYINQMLNNPRIKEVDSAIADVNKELSKISTSGLYSTFDREAIANRERRDELDKQLKQLKDSRADIYKEELHKAYKNLQKENERLQELQRAQSEFASALTTVTSFIQSSSKVFKFSDIGKRLSAAQEALQFMEIESQVTEVAGSLKKLREHVDTAAPEFKQKINQLLAEVGSEQDIREAIIAAIEEAKFQERLSGASGAVGTLLGAFKNVINPMRDLGISAKEYSGFLRKLQGLQTVQAMIDLGKSVLALAKSNTEIANQVDAEAFARIVRYWEINFTQAAAQLFNGMANGEVALDKLIKALASGTSETQELINKFQMSASAAATLGDAFRNSWRALVNMGHSANEVSEAMGLLKDLQIKKATIDMLSSMKDMAAAWRGQDNSMVQRLNEVILSMQAQFLAGGDAFLDQLLSFGTPEEMAEIFARQNYISQTVQQSIVMAPYIQVTGDMGEEEVMQAVDRAMTEWAAKNGMPVSG